MVTEEEKAEQVRVDYAAGLTYRELAKKHRKSLRDISIILKGGAAKEVATDNERDELIHCLMRVLGAKTPEEGLKQAYDTAVMMNPYVIYHGVKTPKELIKFFEDQVAGLREQIRSYRDAIKEVKSNVEEFEDMDDYNLAQRLGVNDAVLAGYQRLLDEGIIPESLGAFLNSAVYSVFKSRGYELGKRPRFKVLKVL
jgi:hypothetical protein